MKPGSDWRYSGGGYTVLQLLIEDVTHEPFEKYMKETVLTPLDMTSSTFEQPLPALLTQYVSSGHSATGEIVEGGWNIYPEKASAGLWTTPSDLAKAVIALQNCVLGKNKPKHALHLGQKICEQMLTSTKWKSGPEMGLGFPIRKANCLITFDHGGQDEGFVSYLKGTAPEFPHHGKPVDDSLLRGVIIMTNSFGGEDLYHELNQTIDSIYKWAEYHPIEKTSIHLKNRFLEKLSGHYVEENRKDNRGQMQLKIALKDEQLECIFGDKKQDLWSKPIKLFAESNHAFFDLYGGIFLFLEGKISITLPQAKEAMTFILKE